MIFGAIYIGISGLTSYSSGLQTISNNVANLNTSGFKALTPSFSDLFNNGDISQGFSAGGQSKPTGSGVSYNASQTDYRQGTLNATQNDLDLAIQGNGFLTLIDGAKTLYTRTGQFTVGSDGIIVEQGTTRQLGILDTNGQLMAANVTGKRLYPPQATTKIVFNNNLSSTATTATVSNISVYDSTGTVQTWTVTFTAKGATDPGKWDVTVKDQLGTTLATSTLSFLGSAPDPTSDKITVNTNPKDADPLSVTLDFSTNVTSFSSGTTSTLSTSSVDGLALGTLTTTTVDPNGILTLTYSNGKTNTLGSVALASFADPQKLNQSGNGLFSYTGSDKPQLLKSGSDTVGKVVGRQIEASNVDLSRQFGELILIQRGYQASSQIISVSNDMLQQLFSIRGQ